ncbi:MAG TPA: alternative ribosome rescue aminoacyl-tRNA hydrolase ArfB [Actinoallomurus sp.]|jgi:ribosome-associated protein|nr:alternative ribosome rescue aminoacyl-tRNA hydrolase ArfB [Actinoallomurus sp.]
MSGPVRVRGSVVIPDAELSWRFSRSSGPGGQHVNTSDSAAELSFDVARSAVLPQTYKDRALQRLAGRLVGGVITIRAEEHRSQLRNREAAKDRLSALLAEATAPPPKSRRPTKPSRRVQARRIEGKRRRGQIKRGRSGRFDD